ncbi:MAG TPA: energy transducer TonB [Kofleriaceae bacterium]|nr:energy transducer TonB [Kofleriaceae bacterium]
MSSSASSGRGRPPGQSPRAPLGQRLLAQRHAARARVEARTVRPLSPEQRAFDPLARGQLGSGARLLVAAGVIVLAAGVHAGVYGVGSLFGLGHDRERKRDVVAVEVHEHERLPDKTPPVPPPPERIEKPRPEPRRREIQPPPDRPPPDRSDKPPPRVVGLNLDSTSQGGGGPSFGVGNTRDGETEKRAADPKKVARVAPPKSVNQVASRLPTAGAKYVLPKRKRPARPPYPRQLLAQGVEASVTVMVSLDADGKVKSVKIIRSAGYPEFDESARKTALAEEFSPATRDGTPIPYTLSYTYRFTIDNP